MTLKKLRCFNTGTISAAGTYEKEFSPAEDWHVKHIFISDRSAQQLSDVLIYLKVGGEVLTQDYAPAHLFGSDILVALDIDRDFPKGTSIYFKFENKKSTSVDLDICFEIVE